MQVATVPRNMTGRLFSRAAHGLAALLIFIGIQLPLLAQEAGEAGSPSIDERLDSFIAPVAEWADRIVFFSVPILGQDVPVVLILLAGTGIFLTCYFKFINFRAFGLALRTVRGKYSAESDPGQITHFQALATALSATVGLGNIAGVAVAIGIGGPGAVFWMVVMGLLGMTSKFTECTLGVAYRDIDDDGRVHGGGMRYLEKGLREHGWRRLGKVLAVFFAVACVGGALGAGNMFQMNQSAEQIGDTFGVFREGQSWILGLIVAFMVGAVIIGGIVWIARVTSILVPFMTIIYVVACMVVLGGYLSEIPAALGIIFTEAFAPAAGIGGFVGGLIQGIKRGVFSNEAGLGSAAIAHAPVKTRRPASEGIVALLEPFIDTVVICLMTALVIVTTGVWKADANINAATALRSAPEMSAPVIRQLADGELIHIIDKGEEGDVWMQIEMKDRDAGGYVPTDVVTERSGWSGGIWLTSRSFGSVIPWFPYVLALAVFLFAFSTMISWSYYGEQAVYYLVGGNRRVITAYKIVFCLCVVVGSAASLKNVLMLSDAFYFAMVAPNLIGLYILLPRVKHELGRFTRFARRIDAGSSLEEAGRAEP